jgi:hypothetical protein
MTDRKLQLTTTKQSPKSSARNAYSGFADGEKASMRARAQELKAEARRGSRADKAADAERDAVTKIAAMPEPYAEIGQRLHAIIKASAPDLSAKTWYGLPAYAKAGKLICYLRMNPQAPYNDRYLTFGFNEAANLDEGGMWPIAFGIKELSADDEARIGALVKRAVS